MSTYPVTELLQRWSIGTLTAEQTIGHLLQNLLTLSQRLAEVESRLRRLEQNPQA